MPQCRTARAEGAEPSLRELSSSVQTGISVFLETASSGNSETETKAYLQSE